MTARIIHYHTERSEFGDEDVAALWREGRRCWWEVNGKPVTDEEVVEQFADSENVEMRRRMACELKAPLPVVFRLTTDPDAQVRRYAAYRLWYKAQTKRHASAVRRELLRVLEEHGIPESDVPHLSTPYLVDWYVSVFVPPYDED